MSLISSIESFFVTTEQDVLKVIAYIKKEIPVAEAAIHRAFGWVASQAPNAAADLQTAEQLIVGLGLQNVPDVAAAVTAANVAVAALNAFAKAYNSGTSDTSALVSGYVALKQAQASAASATAAAAQTNTTPSPSAAS